MPIPNLNIDEMDERVCEEMIAATQAELTQAEADLEVERAATLRTRATMEDQLSQVSYLIKEATDAIKEKNLQIAAQAATIRKLEDEVKALGGEV